MNITANEGQARLIAEVIEPGLCVGCGACVGLCPYHEYRDGRVLVMDRCRAEGSRCVQVCPQRWETPRSAGGEDSVGGGLGPCLEICMARAADREIAGAAQYGGVVSALLAHAMETGAIGSALVTKKGEEGAPEGVLARERGSILACAGSRYSAAGTLAELNRALQNQEDRIGVVGLPCQMQALKRMAAMEADGPRNSNAVKIKLGIFCTWSLDFRKLAQFLREQGLRGPVLRYDIPPPPAAVFQVETAAGTTAFPLDEVRHAIQKGCQICRDMTAEDADISVGAAEGIADWNTVLVRTETGQELMTSALAAGVLQTRPLPEANLRHLTEAALNKRRRGEAAGSQLRGGRS